jgi:iron(III) transport system substrate-binding protein
VVLPVVRRSACAVIAIAAGLSVAQAAEVNIYTTREPGLVQPLLDAFTASTGTKVNTVFLKEGIPERVASEGDKSPADVLMTVDIGNLVPRSRRTCAIRMATGSPCRNAHGYFMSRRIST